ncbi:hypothetical protein [Rhodopila globiformis]|uniref:hypothetical protein n=1 Tax=Rhodopila globiformis TaxID=1071 RepID=UPI00187726A4|nr:hypothetical protein [Rhodopila globiformis]
MTKGPETDRLLCPSSQPNHPDARVFGVQTGHSPETFRVGYLTEAHPVTRDLLAQAGEALPTEVLRIAAPCIRCSHHDGIGCRLATRVATMLPPVVGAMPRCAIRPDCLWFRQEGKAACVRCPQVVTIARGATAFDEAVAGLSSQRAEDLPTVTTPAGSRPGTPAR